MTDRFRIRTATPDDAPALAALGAETFTETFGHLYAPEDLQMFVADNHSLAAYQALLADPASRLWLAVDAAGEAAGYAVAGPCRLPVPDLPPEAGEVKRLYLAARYQSAGLGRQLMDSMMGWFEEAGRAPLYLSVYAENYGAQRFYQRYGFEKIMSYEFLVGRHKDPEFIFRRG